MYQAEYTYPKKVTHANLSAGDAAEMSLSLIANDFKQVNIFLTDEEMIKTTTAKVKRFKEIEKILEKDKENKKQN